jgi:outer membrane protein assembly complex protein YaeT
MKLRDALAAALLVWMLLPGISSAQERRIFVRSLSIEGAEAIDEDRLKGILATRQTGWWPWGEERLFDPRAFEADMVRIEAFYVDRGFTDARVTSFDVRFDEERTNVDLTITVSEGEPLIAAAVELVGFDELSEGAIRELRRRMPLQEGQPLDRQHVLESQRMAVNRLGDAGFPYAAVEVSDREIAQRRIEMTFAARPGPRAFFGPVTVVGHRSVGDEVIRRQLLFRPGDPYRRDLLQESQRRLFALGLFQFANVAVQEQDTDTAEVPVVVTVGEGQHRRLEFGLGYGTEENLRGEIEWTHVNFFGGARTASVHGKWSSLDRGVQVNFVQPAFIRPPLSLSIEGRGWYADEPIFTALSRGGRATLNFQPTRRTTFGLSLLAEFERSQIANIALEDLTIRDELIAMGLDPTTGVQDGTLVAVSLTASRSTADNLLDPSRGYVATMHLEQAGAWLPGSFNYYSVLGELRHYFQPLPVRGVVIANRVRFGTVDPFTDLSDIPFFKRYFLGGSTSLRGWGRYQVSPLSGAGLPIGGYTMVETSSELRIQAFGGIGVALFLDAGNVWSGSWDVRPGDMLYAAGPGLRYNTPIGPVRFDIGYQLTPLEGLLIDGEPETRRWRIHFSIGQAF